MNIVLSDEYYNKSIEHADVLVLTGGADISPSLYGQENVYSSPSPYRDRHEVRMYHIACALGIPILGICRGHQLIAALRGGILQQHIENHWGPRHDIIVIEKDTPFRHIIRDGMRVNSLHHQIVINPPPTGRVVALSEEGYIEAIWYPSDGYHPPMLGVQWHPEMLGDGSFEEMARVLHALGKKEGRYEKIRI